MCILSILSPENRHEIRTLQKQLDDFKFNSNTRYSGYAHENLTKVQYDELKVKKIKYENWYSNIDDNYSDKLMTL